MPPVSGHPTIIGDHKLSVFSHRGPASYTQMTAAPVAGGDSVSCTEAGLHNFEAVIGAGLSNSGTYRVEQVAPAANASTNKTAAITATTWVLRWIVVATGAQVANAFDLSSEYVRLTAISRF